MKNRLKSNKFLLSIITLVIPITIQSLISSSLNMVDNLMIGSLGESSIASVGMVNQYFFVFMLALSGINAGAGIFMSQFWGQKKTTDIRKMLGLDLVLSIIVSILFFIPAFIFPETIMRIFVKDAEVINLGIQYLKIISITFIFTSITQAYSTTLRCIGIAKSPMYGSLIGILVNGILNWVLIFGNLGFPALGVAGAAIATSIARFMEMIYIIICAYKTNDVIKGKVKEVFSFDYDFVRVYFQTSSSVIINELVWSLGLTVYLIIYSKIGISAVASMQISSTINNMFMVLSMGLASAAAIIIGNKIGEGEEETAIDYATKLGVLAPIIGLFSGLALWIASPFIVNLFNINPETIRMTTNVLRIMALFAPLRFFNVLMIVGVFRGGGDTKYSMFVQLGCIWAFAIPSAYIGAVYFKLPLESVFFIICLEDVIKVFFEARRLGSKKWIRNVANEIGEISVKPL